MFCHPELTTCLAHSLEVALRTGTDLESMKQGREVQFFTFTYELQDYYVLRPLLIQLIPHTVLILTLYGKIDLPLT